MSSHQAPYKNESHPAPYKNELHDKQSFAARGKRSSDKRKAIPSTSGTEKSHKKRRVPRNCPTKGEENVPCLYCGETFERSRARQVWIQCALCKDRAHEACASHNKVGEFDFVCELCDE